jgi:cholesterol transport system auxiliary component
MTAPATAAPALRLSRRMLAGAATLAFAGCAGLFVSPPPKYLFRLTPVGSFPPDLPHVAAQLLVDVPSAPAALDRRRIALTRSALLLDYFADAEWSDAVPELVQTVLVDSFDNSRAIVAISGSLGLRADFELGGEIRHFEAQYGAGAGPPNVRVSIGVELVELPQRDIVAQTLVDRQVPASANDLPSIAAAFDAALGAVATEIVVWTVTKAAMSGTRRPL